MKRRIVVAGIGAALLLAGCGEATEGVKGEEARQDGGWTASPRMSAQKPFCDSSHRAAGFSSVVRAEAPAEV